LHPTEEQEANIEWKDVKDKTKNTTIIMCLPCSIPSQTQSTPTETVNPTLIRKNKGVGYDRFVAKQIEKVKQLSLQESGYNDSVLVLSQVFEEMEGRLDEINDVVAENAGIVKPTTCNNPIRYYIKKKTKKEKLEREEGPMLIARLNKLTDKITKVRTGFPSTSAMIAFIVVACNGDIDLISKTTTTLTWLEEWVIYFEIIWGKFSRRWVDLTIKYNLSDRTLRRIFVRILNIVVKTRETWPRFASLNKDIALRKRKWNEGYRGKRVVMWDATDVRLYKPSDSHIQRLTYSSYYAGNVGKGSIFIQPCGWMGTHEIWMGAVSDSDYLTRSGILEMQNTYIETHDKETSSEPWYNILDRGFRVTTTVYKHGKGHVVQPSFCVADRRFVAHETIRGAKISSDRSGNERAVRVIKYCSYIKDGLYQGESAIRLCDVYLVWGFQANFVYRPIL
jgi:DDE superfamily endonuclease